MNLIPVKLKVFIIPFPPGDAFNYLYHCPRGHKIVMDGLEDCEFLAENVQVVDTKNEADIYLLTYVPHWSNEKYNKSFISSYLGKKLVVIDWQDESGPDNYLVKSEECLAYFKRSWVGALNPQGIRQEIQHPTNFYPFAYCMMREYLSFPLVPFYKRVIDIGCYLRNEQPNRGFILQIMSQIKQQLPQLNIVVGPISGGNRSNGKNLTFDEQYFTALAQTKILVTCNPPLEGDSRTWEGLSAACCVLVDKTFTPIPDKLENEKHIKEYTFSDPNTLINQIQDIVNNPAKANDIAWSGYNFASEYHMPRSRISYVIRTIRKLLNENNHTIA